MHESRAELALHLALQVMQPLARLLVAQGVTYPQFSRALKLLFLDAARGELAKTGVAATDSALSLLSGVHRKDVRSFKREDAPSAAGPSLPVEVAQRWSEAREYLDAERRPKVLPLRSRNVDTPSFETLVQSVSKDFHTRSVVDEMLRLGLIALEGDDAAWVRLCPDGLAAAPDFAALASEYGTNARDHLAAADANLRAAQRGEPAPFFELALEADQLSSASVEWLQRLAQSAWPAACEGIAAEAETRSGADAGLPAQLHPLRARFGAYFFAEPVALPARPAEAAAFPPPANVADDAEPHSRDSALDSKRAVMSTIGITRS
ncbi:MAG TPA: DUF6502 family protein [Burkholderiaceae bacterium]|nr:DUF6502 family protein [Burkholderiaceae bacterium]